MALCDTGNAFREDSFDELLDDISERFAKAKAFFTEDPVGQRIVNMYETLGEALCTGNARTTIFLLLHFRQEEASWSSGRLH